MNKRFVSFLSVSLATILVVAACGSSGNGGTGDSINLASSETMALVPDGSTLVVSISMKDALADPTIQRIFTGLVQRDLLGEPTSDTTGLGKILGEFQAASGIDLNLVEEIVFFFKPDDTESGSAPGFGRSGASGAAIFRGTIDTAAVIAAASKEFPTVTSYQGHEIRVDEGDEEALAILDDQSVVIGSGASVRQVIDVVVGDASSLSGPVAEAFNSLPKGLLNGIFFVPEGTIGQALDENNDALDAFGGFLPDLNVFRSIEAVGFTLGTEEDLLLSTISLTYPTSELADETLTVLNSVVSLLRSFFATPELLALLDGLDIDAVDNQVIITIRVDPLTLPELQETFEGLSAGL
ncbi:MAG: hypothetical protein IIC82_02020 [Chloroflexi bacterium]|nr:hypothetical protein [Chloroflexota bacterium]